MMAKLKARKPKRPERPAPPIRAHELVRGVRLAPGWRLRLAGVGELDRAAELLALAHLRLDADVAATIRAGAHAEVLLAGLRDGKQALLYPIAEAAAAGDPNLAIVKMAALLVAVDRDDQIGGIVMTVPPGTVFAELYSKGFLPSHALLGLTLATKIQGLAVDPAARGSGLGARMLAQAWRLHHQLGAMVVYGQFPIRSGLAAYYAATPFEVLPERYGIMLEPILGRQAGIAPSAGEQIFARWSQSAFRAIDHV
ncbi:hypothetical protein AB0I28_32355 [Phytomonospora sp. NPDC050363]|uniref:hypothetical protein n=1 Tax=Phytomonospora sp. NPDC050363 TaxID=3155642 RepID=UPI00340008DA